jgi:hypothetical protein
MEYFYYIIYAIIYLLQDNIFIAVANIEIKKATEFRKQILMALDNAVQNVKNEEVE